MPQVIYPVSRKTKLTSPQIDIFTVSGKLERRWLATWIDGVIARAWPNG